MINTQSDCGGIDRGLTVDFIHPRSRGANNYMRELGTGCPPMHCWCANNGIIGKDEATILKIISFS